MWTTELPTEAGAYWVKARPSLAPSMVIVYDGADGRLRYSAAGGLTFLVATVDPQVSWLRAEVPA